MIASLRIARKLVLTSLAISAVTSAASIAYGAAADPARTTICFEDVRSWEAVRAQLPAFMQNNELYAVHQSGSLIAAFKIVQAGATIVMEVHGRHSLIGHIDDTYTMTKVCLVNGKKIKSELSNGDSSTIDIVPEGLKTRGFTFTLTSLEGYEQTIAAIPPRH
jgi:hypothetical protein